MNAEEIKLKVGSRWSWCQTLTTQIIKLAISGSGLRKGCPAAGHSKLELVEIYDNFLLLVKI